MAKNQQEHLYQLKNQLEGELFFDDLHRSLFATDASVYRILPLAVAFPKSYLDVRLILTFAKSNDTSVIFRTAGTSLAGQCVGDGIVIDVSKYLNKILHFNKKERTITVQPGVVRDELNNFLKPYGLFFGPNTSTSNRCMIGGMVGNNSSGTTSIKYGTTRDKIVRIDAILSNGSEAVFSVLQPAEFNSKLELDSLEGEIYNSIHEILSDPQNRTEIESKFPKKEIHRRNTGYALDVLSDSKQYNPSGTPINIAQLLCGSEGTLAFSKSITLRLDQLPPPQSVIIASHFDSIKSCLLATQIAMSFDLYMCEMMDKTILDCTKQNKTQQKNRNFISGDPKALLLCELRSDNPKTLTQQIEKFLKAIEASKLSYASAVLEGINVNKAFELRKAGLGLLGNLIGDKKAVACIEDTAVALSDLPNYISDFAALMEKNNQDIVYYAHAGAGELHLRPILNLKETTDVKRFRSITTEIAKLVKSYRGSFSGEHGDGIVRAEFIPFMVGEKNYQFFKTIKRAFDAKGILNPGKIVDSLPMDENFRTDITKEVTAIKTTLDFSDSKGILRATEKCNGSGDCRKLSEFGGTMCPSYRATRNEKDTTRARANALREFLSKPNSKNAFNHPELLEVFDLCLSCKACSSECPSSVNVAALKSEFLHQYQSVNGTSLKNILLAHNNRINSVLGLFPRITNWGYQNKVSSRFIKNLIGISQQRSIPLISSKTLNKHCQDPKNKTNNNSVKTIYLFNDEFTNRLDTEIGIATISLLQGLNYNVKIINNKESGRAYISKGFLKTAKQLANFNVRLYQDLISEKSVLLGIEPSAIFSFKDEYPKLVDTELIEHSKNIAKHTYLIEEFLIREIELDHIKSEQFSDLKKDIIFHGHCHQKALSTTKYSLDLLNFPSNFSAKEINSGCCGMAGSFGYEKDKYHISMAIGEQTLFPTIRQTEAETIVSANGTSCRHQIKDGANKKAFHPIELLLDALL
ncbi:MAG: FAD-binding oxidoreductase [Bacteroidetes bacterium MedPE-SWsnd-G2]|nr:MAG: FAD-binding oxidoreductase [Bacteroidetes bacterium MedPE-SWsnd-G2]